MTAQANFKALTTNRKATAQALAESKKYIVRSITKKGVYSKETPHPLNCCDTLDDAKARLELIQTMNPSGWFSIEIQ